MSILDKLTEGIVNRDMKKEGAALLEKWERTGLLEGLSNESTRNSMARLLENQAKELLREAATTAGSGGGDVEGFAAVAFPIVRRVFGALIANDLVSVQPMSLPSGLIFFLDFTMGNDTHGGALYTSGDSLYGGNVVGAQLTGGVDLNEGLGTDIGQFYNLRSGYSSPTGTVSVLCAGVDGRIGDNATAISVYASGTYGVHTTYGINTAGTPGKATTTTPAQAGHVDSILQYDPAFTSGSTTFAIASVPITGSEWDQLNKDNLVAISGAFPLTAAGLQIKRLTQYSSSVAGDGPRPGSDMLFMVVASETLTSLVLSASIAEGGSEARTFTVPINDNMLQSNALGSVVGADTWGLENNADIPEINLKVDSVSVTAMTKKLKAKWTPELGQDLNAYHNLDAEVELTSILSEQIALEIDREILEDLVKGASGAVYHWARSPGLFVDRNTGEEVGASSAAPDFTGTVSEWYETLLETVNDVSAQIHRKTLRGGANFLVTSPEVANILEFTSGFRANVTHDDSKGTAGTQNVGSLSKRYDVYVDPYFPRNLVLVGRKGNSFLESGYVYAPYVPLQVTPTIFGVEDFVPRKGVMTRYAKKMVRPDMYGLVIVRGLLGEAGKTS
tara:strand:- start:36483 stop:38333 length:1851 start_codon:yes stop_codon:yes gene_type:complete